MPLRKRISDENLLRYNGMLIGVFELLADARAQIASVNAAIEALRDFWLAQADLDMALLGKRRASRGPAWRRPRLPRRRRSLNRRHKHDFTTNIPRRAPAPRPLRSAPPR